MSVWAGLAVLAGVRLAVYFSRPSLWIDEARLALNIGRMSWLELAGTLDHDQTAPLPFLWAVRLSTELLGVNELGLRLLPVLAGIALIPLSYLVVRDLLGPARGFLAAALVGASPLLLRYGNEVKQYELDAVVTLVALGLFLRLRRAPEVPRRWWALALGGAALVCFSHPAPLVLVALGAALMLDPGVRSQAGWIGRVLMVAGCWLVTFALVYVTSYRAVAGSAYMQDFWSGTYLDPTLGDVDGRVSWAVWSLFTAPAAGPVFGVTGVPFALTGLVGALVLMRERAWSAVVLCIGPMAALVLTSALHLYPVAPRLVTFLTPLVLILYAVPLAELVRRCRSWSREARFLAGLGCVAFSVWSGGRAVWRSQGPATLQGLIRALDAVPPNEAVYIYAGGIPAYTFYTTEWSRPDTARLRFVASVAKAGGPAFENTIRRPAGVRCHGDDLITTRNGRTELWGLAAGTGFRAPFQAWATATDSGWAANEIRRMWQTGAERVWILAVYMRPSWLHDLLTTAEASGAVAEENAFVAERETPPAGLYPLRLPRNPATDARSDECPPQSDLPITAAHRP